ncbi:MAG: ATP-binding protein [Anaeromyxobacteraceae bacterium]
MSALVVNPAVATALVSGAVSAATSAAAFAMGHAGGWKDFRRFGWVALTAAGVSFANAGNTLEGLSAAWIGRVQFLLLALHVLAWHGYLGAWSGVALGRRAVAALLALTALPGALGLVPGALGLVPGALYSDAFALRVVPSIGVAYRDAQVTSTGGLLLALPCAAALWAYGRIVRHARQGVLAPRAHLAGGALMGAVAAHDAMLTLGVGLPTPYLIDFASWVPIIGIGLAALDRVGRSSAELAQLRERLEARVVERTAELARANAALGRAERLAALGQLSAGVAHEVNNPAAIISSSLNFVAQELGPSTPPEVRGALDDARSAVGRIAGLTRQLLVAGRAAAQPMALVPVDVAACAQVAAQAARARGAPEVAVTLDFPPGLTGLAQGGALEQVLSNLAVNAVQAIPRGRAGRVALRGEQAREHVVLTVEDDGEGMGPEALRHLGEPFYSTKPVGVGSGLGLAVARGLTSAMSGSIVFESEPGRGTRVRITLVRADSLQELHRAQEAAPAPGPAPARAPLE